MGFAYPEKPPALAGGVSSVKPRKPVRKEPLGGKPKNSIKNSIRFRVRFLDMDEETSYELQILHPHTHKDKAFWMPRVGEKVVCLMLNLTDGFIVGAYYHKDCPTPTENGNKVIVTFEDGTWIEYDKGSHKLYIHSVGDIEIVSDTHIVLKAPRIDLNP